MKITIHDRPASFLAAAGGFMACAEVENSMMAIPAARMVASPHDEDRGAYFATVADANGVVCVALQSPAGALMVSAGPDSAVSEIAVAMMRDRRKPKGVVGPLEACEAFARAWNAGTDQGHSLRVHLRHFELTQLPEMPQVAGSIRIPHPAEHAVIGDWHAAFAAEVNLGDDAAKHRDNAARRIAAGESRVWDDGGMVAYAAFASDAETARIAPVYTAPGFRARGYASALVACLARELFARGKRALFITTDVANPVSNRIYARIGFRPVADHFGFDFVSGAS